MIESQLKILKVSKGVKVISLLRYLLSKILYEDQLTERDLFALYQVPIIAAGLVSRDKNLHNKFGDHLGGVHYFLKQVQIDEKSLDCKRYRAVLVRELSKFLVPRRNYNDFKSRFQGSYHLHFVDSEGIPVKKLPPKRRMGVGYRDKGSAQVPEIDASPKWQSVARSAANLERKVEENLKEVKEAKSGLEAFDRLSLAISYKEELVRLERDPRYAKEDPRRSS